MTGAPDHARVSLGAAILLGSLIIALWLLQHPYAGIHHDAQLYTLQALARVNPGALSQDVFLRYGSQDSFTCFGVLYAAAIHAFGVAPAAALLTFLSHCAFAGAALLLARRLLPGRLAVIAAGLVCVIPLTYGAQKVFYVMEDFVTPRLLAQALVLAGLAALLERRYILALIAGVAAALLHPVMAMSGWIGALFVPTVTSRWRLRLIAAGAVLGAAAVGILTARGTPLRFDDEWWPLVHDGLPYLFPLEWRKFDWARVIVLATFLYAAARRSPDESTRRLYRAMLAITAAALACAILGGDVLRLVIVTQLQPWRMLWLATALALLATPRVVPALWSSGSAGRIALVTMLCAFLLGDERFALTSALVAAAALLICERARVDSPVLRPILLGSYALLALSLVINLGSSAIVARTGIDQGEVSQWLQTLRSVSATGALPAVALCSAGWAAARATTPQLYAAAGGGLLLAALFAGAASPPWRQSPYSAATRTAFSAWRERIPPGAEVLWFTSPLADWVLLERSSYVSVQQTASALFSRDAAMVLRDRVAEIPDFLRAADPSPWRPSTADEAEGQGTLVSACGATRADFIVTRKDLASAPIAVAGSALPAALRGWKLYACERGDSP